MIFHLIMMNPNNAFQIIQELKLNPHPEGGYFKEIYRSSDIIQKESLRKDFSLKDKNYRHVCTSIYYLLIGEDISHFHRILSDEIWHFYSGTTLRIHILDEIHKEYQYFDLGTHYQYQVIIPKKVWFAAEVLDTSSYALVGCTVAPGFEFSDFELASFSYLSHQFPQYRHLIQKFTK